MHRSLAEFRRQVSLPRRRWTGVETIGFTAMYVGGFIWSVLRSAYDTVGTMLLVPTTALCVVLPALALSREAKS